jgi:diaminopimelate decarboxylase
MIIRFAFLTQFPHQFCLLGSFHINFAFLTQFPPQFCSTLREALDLHFPPWLGLDIIAEPGRYFVSSAFAAYPQVIGKKRTGTCMGIRCPIVLKDAALACALV